MQAPIAENYLLGHSQTETERLRCQPQQLAGETNWLLDQLDIRPGCRVVDIGCGPLGVLDLLAERVGPSGTVVGIDQSEAAVRLARQYVADHHLANVEVLRANARATGLPRASFDAAVSRLVLVNVPNPDEIVRETVDLVRPGGMVALHEADYVSHLCHPPIEAWDRLASAYGEHARAEGIDLNVGRRVPALLRDAGIVDVQMRPVIHLYPFGHPRRPIFLDFLDNVRAGIVQRGLLTDTEITELLGDVRTHLDDPEALVVSHLFFQVWGRKPTPRDAASRRMSA